MMIRISEGCSDDGRFSLKDSIRRWTSKKREGRKKVGGGKTFWIK